MLLMIIEYALNAVNQGVTALGIKGMSRHNHVSLDGIEETKKKGNFSYKRCRTSNREKIFFAAHRPSIPLKSFIDNA